MRSGGIVTACGSKTRSSLVHWVVKSLARPPERWCRWTQLAYRRGSLASRPVYHFICMPLTIGLASLVGREGPPVKRNGHVKLTSGTNPVNLDRGATTRALVRRKDCTTRLSGAIVAFAVDTHHPIRRTERIVKKLVRRAHRYRTVQIRDGKQPLTAVDLRDALAKTGSQCSAHQFDPAWVRREHCPREVARITIEKEQDDLRRGITRRFPGGTSCPA